MTNKTNKVNFVAFILLFNALWLIRVFFIGKTQNINIDLAVSVALKFLIFVVIPFFYIKYIYKESPISVFKLNTNIKNSFKYGIIGLFFITILGVVIYFSSNGKIEIKGIGALDLFFAFVFAAFFEEVVFRGLILSKLNQLMNFKKANIIAALLFTCIHIPQYIANGTFTSQVAINSYIIIFVWAILDGIIVKKSNSLWSVIIIHGAWDCAVHLLGF